MVKNKKPAAPLAPALAEPPVDKSYGWNVMSDCLNPEIVLEHKSKSDYVTLLVGKTPEGDWVGGYLCRTGLGTFNGGSVSLKGARFRKPEGAATWAAGQILGLSDAKKLTPNAVRKLEALVCGAQEPEAAPTPEPTAPDALPCLDANDHALRAGDVVKIIPDVSKSLSGRQATFLGNYDAAAHSVEIQLLDGDKETKRILPYYIEWVETPGVATPEQPAEEAFDPHKLPHFTEVRAEQNAAAAAVTKPEALASVLVATQAPAVDVQRITSGISSMGSLSPEIADKFRTAVGRRQEPVAPFEVASQAAHLAVTAEPTPEPAPAHREGWATVKTVQLYHHYDAAGLTACGYKRRKGELSFSEKPGQLPTWQCCRACDALFVRGAGAEVPAPPAPAPAPAAVATEQPAEPERLSVVATVQEIPLADIDTSRNYRKVFDDASLYELAQSIEAHGIMQAVLVRPTPAGQGALPYQLVYGGRRYRSAQLVGLPVIPAMVRVLTDLQFAEAQLIENVQRQDVQPSDEAKAFNDLLSNHGLSPEEVALKVGRPVKFVLQRAKLTALEPFWMELLEVGRLPLVAAHALARLPAAGQGIVAKSVRESWEFSQGNVLSTHNINSTISSQVLRQLDKAPWPKDDAELYPKAGPCTTCPKRSGACRGLFDDLQAEGKVDTCLDAGCFATKTAQYVQRRILEVKGSKTPLLSSSWDKAPAGALGYRYWDSSKEGVKGAVPGLLVDGADAGHLKWVLVNKSAADAAQVAEQKKADRSAEIRQGKISEKFRQLLTGHLYTTALSSNKVLETLLDNQIYGELRSQGGPHTVLRFGLVEQMGWEMPEGGAAVLKKLTPASNMEALQAWQKKNVSRLSYAEKLALYFALLGYNCSTFDVHNDRLQKYAKAAGANPNNLKKAAEALVDDKGRNGEAKQ